MTARRAIAATLVGLLAVGWSAGCTSAPAPAHIRLVVSPLRALYDTPISVRVTGVHRGSQVTISATSTAIDGKSWTDSATFVADSTGAVTTAQAPVSGSSYADANAMGIFEDEAPGGNADIGGSFLPKLPWTITVAVTAGGHEVTHSTVTRLRPSDLAITATALRPARQGVYGEFYAPAASLVTRRPAVLVFGGSEGGLSTEAQAALLAAHGFPALALAYFHEPGLPATLDNIPLEYFARALRILSGEPQVDPKRMIVWGYSRGSEAALLVATHYRALVSGAIVSSPSDIAFAGIPATAPAWTLAGKGVPTAPRFDFGQTDPVGAERDHIDVANIRGPIFAICGGQDGIWPSCAYARAIASTLAEARSTYRATVAAYPRAGHFVGSVLPYVPSTQTQGATAGGSMVIGGGEPAADEAGRADAWRRLLTYVARVPSG